MSINRCKLKSVFRLVIAGSLVAVTLAPVGPASAADPVAPSRSAPAATAGPAPRGVSPQSAVPATQPPAAGDRARLGLRPKNTKGSTPEVTSTCWPYAYVNAYVLGYDEYLEEVAGISHYGGVDCDISLDFISGEIGGVDRSPAFNGQAFNGVWLGSSGIFGYGPSASGSGGVTVRARTYNGARYVEPVLSLILVAPGGLVWDFCGSIPGLVYYTCSGLGTSTLSLLLGGFIQSSGLTPACRDQSVSGDAEQARLFLPNGSTLFSTQILGIIPNIRNRVIGFKQALCYTGAAQAAGFATTQGQQLWDTAVTEAKNPANQNEDRPLYWARLSMTTAIEQWRPPFAVNRAALQNSLDWAARGMNSHDFTLGTAKRALVTGFDPFGLDGGGIVGGNPSAAAVLGLDNTTVGGAEVQVVILPVRYDDFDTIHPTVLGIAETAVAQHLAAGPQRATLITTVSQGGPNSFELECWNGRNRSADPFRDNRNRLSGGTASNPVSPGFPNYGPQLKQFAASTLPVQSMLVGSSFPVIVDGTLFEVVAPGSAPTLRNSNGQCQPMPSGPSTPGWIAAEGSGGGFLSNELPYRVTEMRDQFGSPVKAGHIHTPALDLPPTPARRNLIVNQYRQILAAAIANS